MDLRLLWLLPLGLAVGAIGTLIGAGGGFLLVPVLLLMYPGSTPETITSISLAVVFFNAASGSVAYARMRRIDYRSAAIFSAATVPSAILGAFTTTWVPRHTFDVLFGAVMIAAALYLIIRPHPAADAEAITPNGALSAAAPKQSADDLEPRHRKKTGLGVLISVFVGYVSSLLGIGGGIIHVPALVRLLDFPVHIATATSHLILAVTALAGTLVHVHGDALRVGTGLRRTALLAVGVVVGAQLGARLSNRMHSDWIIRALAAALAVVGLRILFMPVR